LLSGNQVQFYDHHGTNLSTISEEHHQTWKPHDEEFLKAQRLMLAEEFENDSGFKSSEDVALNVFKLKGMEQEPFLIEGPQMTSSARSSIELSPGNIHRIRVSLELGPNHKLDNLEKELFMGDRLKKDDTLFSNEMISMGRRSSIDGKGDKKTR
jgi:hypothetical protein